MLYKETSIFLNRATSASNLNQFRIYWELFLRSISLTDLETWDLIKVTKCHKMKCECADIETRHIKPSVTYIANNSWKKMFI